MVCRDKAEMQLLSSLYESGDGVKYDVILVSDTMIEDPDDPRSQLGNRTTNLATSINDCPEGGMVWTSTSVFPLVLRKRAKSLEEAGLRRITLASHS